MTPEFARKIVEALMTDLDDRKGFDISNLDDEALREWQKAWTQIILEQINAGV